MPARALPPAVVAIAVVLLSVGCSSGAEVAQPTVTATETVTASPDPAEAATPDPTPTPVATPAPEPEEPLVDDAEAYAVFTSADDSIAFEHPGSWDVVEQTLPGLGTRVTVTRSGGLLLLEIWLAPLQSRPSLCDPPSTVRDPMVALEAEPLDPFVDGSTGSTVRLEIATVELGDGSAGVTVLQEAHVARGCLDLALPVGGSTLLASTPWPGSPGLTVHDAYPGGATDFVGSFEHGRLLALLRSLQIRL